MSYEKKCKKFEQMYGMKIAWHGKKRILGMPISFTRYILGEDKLITRVGLLNLREDELELYKVTDKQSTFPFFQRIFGCGTLTLISTDKDTPHKILKNIKKPRDVRKILDELVTVQRDKYMIRGRDMVGANMAHDCFESGAEDLFN